MPAMRRELSWLEGGRQAVRPVNSDKGKCKVPCVWTPEAPDVDLGPLCLDSEGKVVLRFLYLIKSFFFSSPFYKHSNDPVNWTPTNEESTSAFFYSFL